MFGLDYAHRCTTFFNCNLTKVMKIDSSASLSNRNHKSVVNPGTGATTGKFYKMAVCTSNEPIHKCLPIKIIL